MAQPQRVRLHLLPVEARALAIDSQAQVVLVADADLARDQHTRRTAGETQQHGAVVIEHPARHDAVQRRGDLLHRAAGHELGEVERMHADVADAAARAGLRGVESPARLLVPVALDRRCEPALRVLDQHLRDPAQFAAGDALACLADHRVAGIGVRQRIVQTRCARRRARAGGIRRATIVAGLSDST